jgi:hypothetical protein
MIARGERPCYRVIPVQDGSWTVDALPWLVVMAARRRGAMDEARAAIADWLEVGPDSFDVDTGEE